MPYRLIIKRFSFPELSAMILASLTLAACSESALYSHQQNPSSTPSTLRNVSLPVPQSFTGLRAVQLDNLFALLYVDGYDEPFRYTQSTPVTATFKVNKGDNFRATIRWYELLDGTTELLLASKSVEQAVSESLSININSSEYTTSGSGYDADNDNFSNLIERTANSDPLDPNSIPSTSPDVRISSVNSNEAPIIDGLYDAVYTRQAQFNDDKGELLSIDNLMVNQGALRENGNTEFRWFSMHDGTYLYIFVLGERVSIATPIRDSTEFYQDDSIDIFIDGDNSKGSSYDGIDDRHLIIPLLSRPNTSEVSNTTAIVAGPNSAPLPPITFATCLCTEDQHTWEVRLPMAEFGITGGSLFGIEVQINEDNNGGARDAKWGWFHPAGANEDADNTYIIPSFMGTAVLR